MLEAEYNAFKNSTYGSQKQIDYIILKSKKKKQ
uniref:Uncharacterized protein n=1 Tax=Rhizophora mucronata TaxID=61149 RepID=A0A2P2IQL9_RHIMU